MNDLKYTKSLSRSREKIHYNWPVAWILKSWFIELLEECLNSRIVDVNYMEINVQKLIAKSEKKSSLNSIVHKWV